MPGFNPENYAPVEDRLPLFWEKHPEGRIETELLRASDDFQTVIVIARLFRDGAESPFATGMAEEHQGGRGPNQDCWLENCETSAIGRALANAGWHGSVNGGKAPRPSRQEMDKASRSAQGDGGGQSGSPRSGTITEKQAKFLHVLCDKKSKDPDGTKASIKEKFGVESFNDIPYDGGKALIDKMAAMPDASAASEPEKPAGTFDPCPTCGSTESCDCVPF